MGTYIDKVSGHEVQWDGRTVWVNDGKTSINLGRFSKTGVDVHHDLEGQQNGKHCLDCNGDTTMAGWERFKLAMKTHHGIELYNKVRPKYLNPRELFKPKLPELKEQCASCPFKDGNDEEFGEVVRKLCRVSGTRFGLRRVGHARAMIRREATMQGDFVCHHTVYNKDMATGDPNEFRQCPGATKHFKAAGESL